MTIEQTLLDILAELRGIRADVNATLKPSTIATLAAMSPQPPAPPVQPVTPPIALYTVAAPPPPTAPVAPTATSPEPTSVFAQAAAPSAAPVIPAAPPTVSPAPIDSMSAALQADAQKLAAMGQSGAAVLPNGVELDVKGLPWDGRIHASSKAKVADGSWRMKRGVDEALVATVIAELKAAVSAPASVLPPGSAASLPWPFATSAADVQPLLVTAVPPPPPTSAYAALMSRLTHHINVGDFKPQQVTDACISLGVPSVAALAAREDLVPSVALALGVAL